MEEIKKNLEIIGLSQEEIEVYLTSLGLGAATVLQITMEVDIPRTTVYLIIDSLLAKGLITQTVQGKKKLFIPASPEQLIQIANDKKTQLESTITSLEKNLTQLTAVYNLKVEKPKIRYYDGVEGIKTIYEETLEHKHIFVHCMTQTAIELMGEYLKTYFDRLIRKMIYTQEIVSDTEQDKRYQKKYSTSRNEIVCIPQKYITNTDYFIYGDNVAFITYKGGQPAGVVIQDSEISHFEKIRFLMVWDMAKEGKLS